METKHFTFDLKSFEDTGAFAGYASVFHFTDSQNDMVLPGAFAQTLLNDAPAKLLWQHRADAPIGVLHELKEDAVGLYVRGEILLSLTQGREAYALLKSGAINGLSIGYRPVESSYDPITGVRYLTEVELFEVSLVTFPANELAGVTSLKSWSEATSDHSRREENSKAVFSREGAQAACRLNASEKAPKTIRDLEHLLRDAGYSRKHAKSIASRGFQSLSSPRDAEEEALIAAIENAAFILQS